LFQPYPSVQFGDGNGANLPWLQELPDPASSAMWGLPVEIDPKTAAELGVANGDVVRVTSSQGQLEAPAYVHPAALPGVVSMALGQGHRHYGRYAAGRGANPLALVATVFERESGALAFGATRVRLDKAGPKGHLVQFAPVDREPHPERH
jgi:molybdopterin-containing oxidoreductase family iron-sulfur binding subunit